MLLEILKTLKKVFWQPLTKLKIQMNLSYECANGAGLCVLMCVSLLAGVSALVIPGSLESCSFSQVHGLQGQRPIGPALCRQQALTTSLQWIPQGTCRYKGSDRWFWRHVFWVCRRWAGNLKSNPALYGSRSVCLRNQGRACKELCTSMPTLEPRRFHYSWVTMLLCVSTTWYCIPSCDDARTGQINISMTVARQSPQCT